jgi:exodeoxyribonuclease VII large subunit
VSLYEKRGEYQIIVDFLEPEGLGALQLAFEQLRKRLQEEGLFDESAKVPVPAFPDVIGVITSETGAALRDILNVINRRYSGVRVIVYPTLVQGDEAARCIAAAIEKANERKETDVLIVGRGGGSLEDLWPFNEEVVARALFNSTIPVISAVGHEIDFTIADFVADVRAPTPSAAAEIVVKNKQELIRNLLDLRTRLYSSIESMRALRKEQLERFTPEVLEMRINGLLREKQMQLDDVTRSLALTMEAGMMRRRAGFEKLVGQLHVLSPLATLSRGYSITARMRDNKILHSIQDTGTDEDIITRLVDGTILSRVRERNPGERGAGHG